ncbi:MAG: formyltransferase family protein [Alphaproteobacteria bacterium]|jgi:methionyl-tRNA formyltransferase|nr:hypothetical protein [Rhodospirillaceae bacterium]MBT6204915.1 hypothetical protein [Rhodospirillaceae bacterium]MBT6509919.1 hypothetical protein [Rhodospirillaceae bacterium]MBT7649337.1 hypothetical protein [Rhodospirillaceae bacterium]MDG2481071.1 formyltransferase family protein [Alphaproteobacteria bacterium]
MNGSMLKVAALTTPDGILGGHIIRGMLDAGVVLDAVFLDPTPCSAREGTIHALRTDGGLPPLALARLDGIKADFVAVEDHNSPAAVNLVRERSIDLLVNAGTPRIFSPALLAAPAMGVLSCHPGRLPDYRGSCAVEHAILENQPVANTVHLMSEGIDEGPVLEVRDIDLTGVAIYPELRVATYKQGFVLLGCCVGALQAGKRTRDDFIEQGAGNWHGPVDDMAMSDVEARVADGRYLPLHAASAA